MYNGFLSTQRLVQDWIMEASGAKDEGYFVSEHGVRCKSSISFFQERKKERKKTNDL